MTAKEKAAAKAAAKNAKKVAKGLTAAEIKEQFAEQLATSEVVLVNVNPRGKDKVDYQFAQLGSNAGSADLAIIMRVRGKSIGSGIRSAYLNGIALDQHKANEESGLIVGQTIPDAKLVVIETTVPPAYEDEDGNIKFRSPKRIPAEGVAKEDYPYATSEDGKLVWSSVELRPLDSEDRIVKLAKGVTIDTDEFVALREEYSLAVAEAIEEGATLAEAMKTLNSIQAIEG